ncbi:MAG: cell division topological specificity factor MinE [Clostridiales bacterium]|nr:cell division topological specificity factor MinE [Clostridiales bacterium]
MIDTVNRFFGKDPANSSKNVAKERLRLVLMHDRTDIPEAMMEALRVDLINVISKYMDIDKAALDVSLSKEAESVALVANIPVLRIRRNAI